ncbi:SAM hydrolase/SAM-dependent halogenase family protein [Haloarcula onubensis]|uniref:SAM-dependent chlorinase/fluorinase n=1 Tax=Haloarcula onubensis TaxID=2950539 RepID=A0ABU2FL17_9EURY|nr:SAM-dependent chlorinase/fluorinase [Halomicroarcula sp. S3CR25-11]MDS0281104.1 SAM-dependent chlorinase/fluorinase [Halomicroarcula sp. S3CR25-11]
MITLASDFGSPYPAAMKGVVCRRSDARIEDVAHDLPRQDVRAAAFWLTQTLPYFPPAVHCAVVDPGVGTDRSALVVRAGDHALVGPDNGVLLPAARELADEVEVFRWAYEDPESSTFHGRDVFAPAAATVHNHGVAGLDELPRTARTDSFVDLWFPDPTVNRDGARGEVLVVDDFGNAITNVSGEELAAHTDETVTVNGRRAPVRRAYAGVEAGEPVVTVGSHGNVELAVNRGRGDDAFDVSPGDAVELRW